LNLDKNSLYSAMNHGILSERLNSFHRNLNLNIPMIRNFGGLAKVVPRLSGKKAVIIGAGPSLDGSLQDIKNISRNTDFVIIASDIALLPLCKSGIVPEFVITCETTPRPFFREINTSAMTLLAFSCSSNSNLRQWKGDMMFYNWMIHTEDYLPLWEKAGIELGYAATASIVTTQAVSIALGCGIKSLILCGNDLAFKDRFYTDNTINADNKFMSSDRLHPAESLNFINCWNNREYKILRNGIEYWTNSQFLTAKYWLEDLFPKCSVPVYDTSVPGCSSGGVISVNSSLMNRL